MIPVVTLFVVAAEAVVQLPLCALSNIKMAARVYSKTNRPVGWSSPCNHSKRCWSFQGTLHTHSSQL